MQFNKFEISKKKTYFIKFNITETGLLGNQVIYEVNRDIEIKLS